VRRQEEKRKCERRKGEKVKKRGEEGESAFRKR
jgi:hypothetical protein